ncbi:hypothetical protein KVC23_03350 [Helicobacter pylori]|nr:hypothetical protein [Helicobacter pylori]WQT32731.1 hypothetical protein KVC23_03350 [Helicobacter pylori]
MTEWQKRKLAHQRKLDRLTKFHYENKMHFEIMRCAVEKNYQLSPEQDREYENYMIKELRKFYRKLQSELKKGRVFGKKLSHYPKKYQEEITYLIENIW